MRTHRIRIAAAAAVTAAALSLTACQGSGGGTRDEGRAASPTTTAPTTPAPTASAAPTATSAPTATPPSAPTGPDSSGNGSTSPQGSTDAPTVPAAPGKNSGKNSGKNGGKSTADTADRPCDASAVRVVYSPVSRPLNHALLTVTNTGRTACSAYYAPVLRLDDGQAAVAVDQDSKPQAVVTLFPGESAYAAMILSAADGSGQHGRTSKKLTVWFAPRDNVGSAGGPAVLKLPAGTYTDSTTRVTYWQTSMEHALGF